MKTETKKGLQTLVIVVIALVVAWIVNSGEGGIMLFLWLFLIVIGFICIYKLLKSIF